MTTLRQMHLLAAALTAALAAPGCGGPPSEAWRPAPTLETATPSRWSAVLAAWTRHGEAYEKFEGRLFVNATCFSPALMDAWLRARADREGWSAERLAQALAAETTAQTTRLRMLVGVMPQDSRWDDAAPNGTLEFSLTADSIPLTARSAKKLSDDEIADYMPYFTWLTPLHSLYMVEFPPLAEASRLALRVAGPPARIVLHWQVAP